MLIKMFKNFDRVLKNSSSHKNYRKKCVIQIHFRIFSRKLSFIFEIFCNKYNLYINFHINPPKKSSKTRKIPIYLCRFSIARSHFSHMSSEKGDNNDLLFKSGWLKKKGNFLGMWQKCFCELKITELYIRKSDKSKKIDNRVIITETTTVRIAEGKKSNFLLIKYGNNESIKLKSGDQNDLEEWLIALRSATFHNSVLSMNSFNIISVIGRGFFGKVMLVEKKDSKELYAIKTVHKMRLLQTKKVNTILAERNIMRRCEHPFIVSLKFAFHTATKFYLGLEYIAGGELFYLMRRHAVFSIQQIRLFVAEIALALDHLHKNGIIYRDLKPENILIGVDGHLKLTDFGLSKDISDSKMTRSFCGTPEFMAPEIVLKKQYSFGVDWWTLGVLTYELFFEKPPFYDNNRNKMFSKILNEEPTFPKDFDQDAFDFINKLLKKDAKLRYDFDSLKEHPFWNGINFDDVLAKKYTPEYIPLIHDPRAVEMFEEEFTQEQPVDSIATPCIGDYSMFKNFTFIGSLDKTKNIFKKDDTIYPMAEQSHLPTS